MFTIKRIVLPALMALALTLGPAMPALAAFHENLRSKILNRPGAIQEKSETFQQKREERREGVEPKSEERREAATEQREAAKARLTAKREAAVRAHLARMVKRFEAALERMKKFGERIQSRIEKARAKGKDVSKAQAALERTQAAWRDARAGVEDLKSRLDRSAGAGDARQALKDVRAAVDAGRDKIKAAHAAFVDVITTLKGLGGGSAEEGASPPAAPAPAPVAP